MRVLLTRPRADSEALARQLEARGHDCLIEPMIAIERVADDPAHGDDVQALILTSANAAPALAGYPADLPVFAVGEATAAAARAHRAARVEVAGGEWQSLARLIARRCRPGDGALVHLCGREVREGLGEALADAGFVVRRRVVYRAVPAARLSQATSDALRQRRIDAVLLYSPRTARLLVERLRDQELNALTGTIDACCLSPAVAAACADLSWRSVQVASQPAGDALLDLLDGLGRRW